MFSPKEIKKMVFFDVETATSHKNYNELSDRMKDLWSTRCEWLRSNYEDNRDKTDEELYYYKGALHAEYNKVLCVSFGRVDIDELGNLKHTIHTCYGHDEKQVLTETIEVFKKFNNSKFQFVGHNIKNFDIPVILRRALINGVELPSFLHLHNLKPWETPFLDTSDVWKCGSWNGGNVSLDLLSACLGVPTPKDEMNGSMVSEAYWKHDQLDDIVTYCEKDVVATANVVLKLANQKIIENENT
jgi:predicted PolB exonuclease-like 3'-5' exonuclease